jgi:kynureninase
MAALRPSLAIFSEVGMLALREKSLRLTGFLEYLVDGTQSTTLEVITPRRGCQLSLRIERDAAALFDALSARGVMADFREPDVIRVAPVPLYNTFHEVWRFGLILREALAQYSGSQSPRKG